MSSPPVGQASSLPIDSGRQDACPTWFRWSIYWLLIVISASIVTARIMRVRSPDAFSPTPFQSANDKSRWCTIRALGDHGVYSIEHIIFYDDGSQVRGWHTIDLVRHRGPDGREHYYSSKPTLLPTLLAGQYWLIKQATLACQSLVFEQPRGFSLSEPRDVWTIVRTMLVLTNVVPLVVALYLLARLIDDLGQTDWGRLFTFAAAALATFVTTYSVTLNNHSLAACTLVFALAATIPIWQGHGRWWHFVLAGLFFAFTAANELPALALFALAAAGLAWKSPVKTAFHFAPPALLVGLLAIATNINAHGDWRTPYAHRQDGHFITTVSAESISAFDAQKLPSGNDRESMLYMLDSYDIGSSDQLEIVLRDPGRRWELWDPSTQQRFALVLTDDKSRIEIRRWDNWYDYPGTHWDRRTVTGLDRGEPSPLVYAFHCLIGHHGLFSLTPIWLLSIGGCWIWWRSTDHTSRSLALTTALITLIVLAFYLSRPLNDRNYGGGTCCLRWLVWLTPLWLLTLVPAADWLGKSRWGQIAAVLLLAISALSAHYAADNPWAHPWLFTLGEWLGWFHYP